ncbi:MAG TPA: MFS transporter [Chloroflexota bacterium]|nr:MFS transporter [Chloroflexota bacterium]
MRSARLAVLAPYRVLAGNQNLSLLFSGQVASAFGDRLYIVVVMVLAYNLTHSATVVALLNLMRLLPNAVFLPLAGLLADRFNRKALMIGADLGRGVCMLGLLAVHSQHTLWLAFVLIFLTTSLLSVFRPALNAVLPAIAGDDDARIKANALMSQVDAYAWVVAPALGGLLLALGQPSWAFAINAATYLVSAGTLCLLRIPPRAPDTRPRDEEGWVAELFAGFKFLFRENAGVLRGVVMPVVGYQLFEGAFWALLVLLSEQVWRFGGQGTGFVNTAYGLGGLAAGLLIGPLLQRVRPASGFALAIGLRSIIVLLLGLSPGAVWPFLVLGMLGFADICCVVLGVNIIQSATPAALMGRSFAAFESTSLSAKVIGTLLAGPLIAVVGPRATTVFYALAALALLATSLPLLRQLAPVLGVRLFLRRVPQFTTLSRATLDQVASLFQEEQVPAGHTIIRQGEPGDKLYIIKSGAVTVFAKDPGGRDQQVDALSAMEYFGEIALLRDVPRTATVRARGPVELYSLTRASFQELMARSEVLQRAMTETGDTRSRRMQEQLLSH